MSLTPFEFIAALIAASVVLWLVMAVAVWSGLWVDE